MPLTNVWTRNSNGEWTRTTAMQTDKQYSYSVSAYSHHFRCYNCFQYVTFVKGSSNRISHFKHSAGYSDKDCEDRSFNDNAAYTNASVANMEMPMRLTVDNSQITVSIGLLPINYEELNSDMFEGAGIGKAFPLGSGHGTDYWSGRDSGKEIFAEITSAEAAHPGSLMAIKEYFPKTYKVYQDMLKARKKQ